MDVLASYQLKGNSNERVGMQVTQSFLDNIPLQSVEIKALPAAKSEEAATVLYQRMLRNNPLRLAGQKLACQNSPELEEHKAGVCDLLSRYIPAISWLPKLTRQVIQGDVVAGLTVGVMVIPQSMSYASIAGLQYIYGMYAACIPTLVYAFFGQSRQLAVGPVAMVSLLIQAGLQGQLTPEECPQWNEGSEKSQAEECPLEYAKLAFLASAVVGVFQIVASVLRLGFLVSFLGHPVISGFTSGAAIIIGLSQLKYILGFSLEKSQFVYVTVIEVASRIGETDWLTLLLGCLWLGFLVANRKLSRKYKRLSKLGPLGPLISCAAGILLVWLCAPVRDRLGKTNYVGEIPSGLMPFSALDWDFAALPRVLPTALTACLIGYMESIAIGKNLANQHGYELEAGQELLALGLANLVGAAFSCYPVTGSFSRSAVNNQTGAKSQFSGLVTAIVMFCTLLFLTPLFFYLPKFSLAAIVMASVFPLVAYGEAIKLWRVKRVDFVLWVVAFLGTLFLGVLMGILVAVGLSLLIVISESVRPQISILWRIPGTTIYRSMKQESSGTFIPNIFIVRIGASLYFANAAYVKDTLLAFIADLEAVNKTEYVVLEMTGVVSIDSTAAHSIHEIVHDFRHQGIQVAFAMVGNRVEKTMRKAGLVTFIGEQWFLPTVNDAVQYCVRHQRCKRLKLGGESEVEAQMEMGGLEPVQISSEVGFSNQMHHAWTAVFVSLAVDVPMIMSEIANAFKRNNVSTMRAEVEPLPGGGAKHTYFLQSIKTATKLKEWEIMRLREELMQILDRAGLTKQGKDQPDPAAALAVTGEDRVKVLEARLAIERSEAERFKDELARQGRLLDSLVAKAGGAPSPMTTDAASTESKGDSRGSSLYCYEMKLSI
mmetsp:Transcript_47642/g.103601  ORF Transcript_47642/g.103601 Transcript_47642/m.103601 type:complete len:883 (-) Transcript_47642:78-2726(-)|eukprot:CAMPEP_0170583388 /NCGR_PEP_ID=MMETSP0224-20130122/8106_1 /TAXON_ID=285029 /ORGANISM="Togula jolla, Strain CCCM 725" /LENGTH=882 /DNA_ID=CAMNT_0010906707 /DNA_START=74 /DNA_END=2722 /DNA_ORIENTATION=-